MTASPAPATGVDMGPRVDVVVLVVTYNSAAVIDRLVSTLPDALAGVARAKVTVVDNASSDGTVDILRRSAPWAEVIGSGGNLGYSAAINRGLRHSPPRLGAYILNPDTEPAPGSLRRLVDAAENDPSIGVAVPRVFDRDGRLVHSLRREPTLLRAFGEALIGGRRAAHFPRLGETVRDPAAYESAATSDWATGAALFVTRRAMDAVGEWDERFFLYSEETDYALRVRDAGLRLRLVPDAAVVHAGGDLGVSPALWSLMTVNRTRLYRKRHRAAPSAAYWAAVVANEAIRAAGGRERSRAALRSLLRGDPERRPEADLEPSG